MAGEWFIRSQVNSRAWEKIAIDGENLSRGWNRKGDVVPTSQGTRGRISRKRHVWCKHFVAVALTCLKPLYMMRSSLRVNLVEQQSCSRPGGL